MKNRFLVALVLLVGLLHCASVALAQTQTGEKKKPKPQWAPTVNFLVGKFDTEQTAPMLELFRDLEFDLHGRSWDIGAAHGHPGGTYSRLTYSQVVLDDGSSAVDSGYESNTTRGMKWKGFKAEKMWRIGSSRWPVAPALSLHGGIGKVSGIVVRSTTESRFVCGQQGCREEFGRTLVTEEPAQEILGGLGWLPIAGLGIGATGSISDRATVTVFFYGMEFPGTYKGGVQFIYWPRRTR